MRGCDANIGDLLLKFAYIVQTTRTTDLPYFDILIVDEYTVLNPEELISIVLFCIVHNKHLVFVGDRCQQNAIQRSQHHARSNYYFLSALAQQQISLNEIIRCADDEHNQKVCEFRDLMPVVGGSAGECPGFTFNMKYSVYENFHSYFGAAVAINENITYLASHHEQLCLYTQLLEDHLSSSSSRYMAAPYMLSNGTLAAKNRKFHNKLLLTEGSEYIYIKRNCRHLPMGRVLLTHINKQTGVLTVMRDNKLVKLVVQPIPRASILDAMYDALMKNAPDGQRLVQYPLAPLYISTYHNAQGLTLTQDIVLNLTKASCESAYVGLSRIVRASQLLSIELDARSMYNLAYTRAKNDNYYYGMCGAASSDVVEVKSVPAFESNKTKNLKILRLRYFSSEQVHASMLTRLCTYFKHNRGFLRKTIPVLDQPPADVDIFKDKIDISACSKTARDLLLHFDAYEKNGNHKVCSGPQ